MEHLYRGRNLPFGDRWNDILQVLHALTNDVIASTGRPPIMMLYPSQAQIYSAPFEAMKGRIQKQVPAVDPSDFDVRFPNEMVLNYCRQDGLACHDITPALMSAARESPQPLYAPRDIHWSVRGNRVAAAAEAAFLRSLLCTNR